MYSLLKIKELKNYRFFRDFTWDENDCNLFGKNNIIYGWNGSGKTTLCDFFYDLECKKTSVELPQFSLLFRNTETEENESLSKSKIGNSPVRIKVFHQAYIQENITKYETINHIFSVGREQIEKIEEINRLKENYNKECEKIDRLEKELDEYNKQFEHFKIDCARIIKTDACFKNSYNKNVFEERCSTYNKKTKITEDAFQKYLTAVRADKLDEFPVKEVKFIQSSVKKYLLDIIKQTPVNNAINSLQSDPMLNAWVEQGLEIHENAGTEKCLFCGNEISGNRFEILKAHFNKSYKELVEKIDAAIMLLRKKQDEFRIHKQQLPAPGLLYTEFRNDYECRKKIVERLCDKYCDLIDQIIQLMNNKKANMICDTFSIELCEIIDEFDFQYEDFISLQNILKSHNEKTRLFNETIEEAKNKIEEYHLSKYTEPFKKHENNVKNKMEELGESKKYAERVQQKYLSLETSVKNSQIPADEINKDISFIMGRDELFFENLELGYQITRKGERAQNLSKGEENAIALVYFFNSFMDVNSDVKNTIIVLDDPISSFDSNFYYNAISYIKEKTEDCGQLFLFTHKFSFFKDLELLYKNEDLNCYLLQRKSGKPHLSSQHQLLSTYHDEYAFLFSEIYNFIKNPPKNKSEYLRYPNMARRLMESFLTFKIPRNQGSMLERVQILQNGVDTVASRAVIRMLNNHSHLRVIKSNDSFDDVDTIESLPDVLNNLMVFMKAHDKMHYDTLALMCDPDYKCDGDAVYIEKPLLVDVPLYEMAASAGTGEFADDLVSIGTFPVTNLECTFAVAISGDSMEPKIHNGSIALVRKCEEVGQGKTAIVAYQGQCYCKKVVRAENTLKLCSNNKNYPPIIVTDISSYKLYGEVLETVDATT